MDLPPVSHFMALCHRTHVSKIRTGPFCRTELSSYLTHELHLQGEGEDGKNSPCVESRGLPVHQQFTVWISSWEEHSGCSGTV